MLFFRRMMSPPSIFPFVPTVHRFLLCKHTELIEWSVKNYTKGWLKANPGPLLLTQEQNFGTESMICGSVEHTGTKNKSGTKTPSSLLYHRALPIEESRQDGPLHSSMTSTLWKCYKYIFLAEYIKTRIPFILQKQRPVVILTSSMVNYRVLACKVCLFFSANFKHHNSIFLK